MEIKDFFITPIVLVLVYLTAFLAMPYVTDKNNAKFFIPGLTLKIVGAIAVGMIYQFYYGGGDTFTYFHLGSKYIWEAFQERPDLAFRLIFAGVEYEPETFYYASKIYTYGDLSSYYVVRVAGFFDILTYHTYSATAVLFAVFSFTGMWALYHVFCRLYPNLRNGFALAILFIPSVFFWGSGILKDTITIGALGWATFGVFNLFVARQRIVFSLLVLLASLYSIYTIKIYILLCFVPAAILWIFYLNINRVRNVALRIMVAPVVLSLAGVVGYYSMLKIGESNERYEINSIAETARITAEWIHYVSEKQGGSAYTLGDFDYSPLGMLRKFPLAVWVTLYRPHLWEAHNIVMLLSALESTALLLFTIFVLYKVGLVNAFRTLTSESVLVFCFLFAISFSFAVGVSTYNFGSLVRYKIPMYPYFVAGLIILYSYAKRPKNREAFDLDE